MTPPPSPARPGSREAAIAARDRHQSRLRTITIAAGAAGVIAAAGVAVTLPGGASASSTHVNSAQHASSKSGSSSSSSSGSSSSGIQSRAARVPAPARARRAEHRIRAVRQLRLGPGDLRRLLRRCFPLTAVRAFDAASSLVASFLAPQSRTPPRARASPQRAPASLRQRWLARGSFGVQAQGARP